MSNHPLFKKPLVSYNYRGSRRSGYVFHPAYDGLSDGEGVWEKAVQRFMFHLDDLCATAELYTDQQSLSEVVGGPRWKKEVLSIVEAIKRDSKDPYELEALAMVILDVDNKKEQRVLPYHNELRKWAAELRHLDLGLTTDGAVVDPVQVQWRSWGS